MDDQITPFIAEDYLDSIELLQAYVNELFNEEDATPESIRSGLETAARAKCLTRAT